VAEVKPLKLRREKARFPHVRAIQKPYVRVLVDHPILHLDQYFDYEVPEPLSEAVTVGALVEVELGHKLTQGLITERLEDARTSGELKFILKVLTKVPYIEPEQLQLIENAADYYGASTWDFIRACIPPFSKQGERNALMQSSTTPQNITRITQLPESLTSRLRSDQHLICAIEVPSSTPYWSLMAEIAMERYSPGSVLILVPNERELSLLDQEFSARGLKAILISSSLGKSERYQNYLRTRTDTPSIMIGTRSSALLALPRGSTIILQDDVDESHYERRSPTWNSRDLVRLRESTVSVLYVSPTISLENASRISQELLPLYRFPAPLQIKFHSANSEVDQSYFPIISEGLSRGSVLVSVGSSGYITSFSCQKCRNIALCTCGGRLYYPKGHTNPSCAICATEFIEWKCPWCQGNKARTITSGVVRKAEEFGSAFSRYPIITSSGINPVLLLPPGNHLVLSTAGVEPRGGYSAMIFLDLEGRLLRTTLRATEELRLHVMRTLTMLRPGGNVFFALQQSDNFLQSILRASPLIAATREIAERDAVKLPPNSFSILISGLEIESTIKVLSQIQKVTILGPFLRKDKKTFMIKGSREKRSEVVELLKQINRIQSMRKEPLLSYQLEPYSLN